jgi:flagellar hook-associated protein 3 FlgL
MRIANNMMYDRFLADLEAHSARLYECYDEVSTQRRLRAPHDDPAGAQAAARVRSERAETAQYVKNADDGQTWLRLSEAALGHLGEDLQRARELVIANASDGGHQALLDAAAKEIDAIIQSAADLGNAGLGGRYLFAGTATLTPPIAFVGPNQAQYCGDTGQQVREIARGQTLAANTTGDVAFMPALDALRDVAVDLRAGDTGRLSAATLDLLDAALDGVLAIRADLGARANRLDTARTRLLEADIALAGQQGKIEDTDLAKALLDLNRTEVAYRAALGVAARVANLTLLDFLR